MNIPKRRLAAIMFTDIVGYSTLMGRDEDQAFEVLKKSRRIHQGLIEKYNGVLIKELGDGMLISFDLASDAVRCAMDLQKKCINENIPLKIGIHEGEMVFEGTDVLGDGVNISARIQDNAKKGSIYISGNVYDAVKNKSEIQTRLIGDKRFKNIKDPVRVFEVLLGNAGAAAKETQNQARRWHTPYIIIGILVIAVIALALWWILPYAMTSNIIEKEKSIAVMPFDMDSALCNDLKYHRERKIHSSNAVR